MTKTNLWDTVVRELSDGGGGGSEVDADKSDKLEMSIDNLAEAIRDLRKEIGVIRENMRTDFSRLIDRQDSQFRWLIGIIIATAIGLASLIYKSGHG